MQTSFQLIGIGSPLVDMLAHVSDDYLAGIAGEKGGMELVDHVDIDQIIAQHDGVVHQVSGGSAANTIIGLSKLGVNCTFLGKLGKDNLGEFYLESLVSAGVCTRRFKHCAVSPTGRCLSMITPDSERTCRTFLGAAMNLAVDEVTAVDFEACDHAHIEGYKLFNRDLTYRLLESAKEAGCTVSLDLASFEVVHYNRDILDDLLFRFVDIVFANEDESRAFCGSDDPHEGLASLSRFCEVTAVKVGADGAYLRRGDDVVKVDAHRVDAVDTTGAGDLWASGFLYGYFNGHDLETCGKMASIIGANVVQRIGATIPEDDWKVIRSHMHGL